MSNRSVEINSCHNIRNMLSRSRFLFVSLSVSVLGSFVVVLSIIVVVEVVVEVVEEVVVVAVVVVDDVAGSVVLMLSVVVVVEVVVMVAVVVVAAVVRVVDDVIVDTINSHATSESSAMSKLFSAKFQKPKASLLSNGHSVKAVLCNQISGPSPSSIFV